MSRQPYSLTVRLVALLAAGLLILQVGVFAWSLHVRGVEQFRLIASDRARLAITLYQLFSALPKEERPALLNRLAFQTFTLSIAPSPPFFQGDSKESKILSRRLHELSLLVYPPPLPEVLLATNVREVRLPWHISPLPDMLDGYVFSTFIAEAALRLPDEGWLVVSYKEVASHFGNLFSLFMELGVQSLLQILLAVAVIRYLTRPLRQLALFADRLTPEVPEEVPEGLPVHGPREVVRTAEAFRSMYARIRSYVKERMLLLASISHDLRTPLARLRFQLENEPTLRRPELVFDALDDLQQKAEDAIDLARTGRNNELERRTNLLALLESLVADYEENAGYHDPVGKDGLKGTSNCRIRLHVHHPIPTPPQCQLRPMAFRRCLENLVDNALRYGGKADIHLDMSDGKARIRIEDNGPGIPEEHMADVFLPFFRLEGSRNVRTGGTGLGLSIARDLARLNHTDIELSNRAEGGLRVTLLMSILEGTD